MRTRYEQILKALFRQNLRRDRERLGITRVAMARQLRMAERSYLDLEYGTYSCSALTLMLYLAFICEEPGRVHSILPGARPGRGRCRALMPRFTVNVGIWRSERDLNLRER